MAYTVNKLDVWTTEIDDKPGALNDKLEALAGTGADLAFITARPLRPGKTAVYLGPLTGPKQARAARDAGFSRVTNIGTLTLVAPNQPGSASKVSRLLADAGINMRALQAATIGNKFMLVIALHDPADVAKAMRLLRKE